MFLKEEYQQTQLCFNTNYDLLAFYIMSIHWPCSHLVFSLSWFKVIVVCGWFFLALTYFARTLVEGHMKDKDLPKDLRLCGS